MTLVFPRDMTSALRWKTPRLKLELRQEFSRTAGGETQAKDLGPTLWRAAYRSVPLPLDEAGAAMADFESLGGAVRSFLLHPAIRPRPASLAAGGTIPGPVLIESIAADHAGLRLTGLPAGFKLTPGDFLSISASTGGYEFHRFVRGGVADAGGVTGQLPVEPHVRPVVSAGDAVTLVTPLVEMRLVPNTLDDPFVDGTHQAIVFEATQVIR